MQRRKRLQFALYCAAALSVAPTHAAEARSSICSPAPGRTAPKALFRTGFERGVSLSPLVGNSNQYQHFSGSDIAGFSFPILLWDTPAENSGILSIIGPQAPNPANRYVDNALLSTTGFDGKPTRALSMRILAASPATEVTQDTFQVVNRAEAVFYARYRIRFDPQLIDRANTLGPGRFWRMFWEMKADPDDYRIRLELLMNKARQLVWHVQGDRLINADPLWESIAADPPIRLDRWHSIELCMDRPNSRFWAAVDGRMIADYSGPLYGPRKAPSTSIKHAIVYGEPREGEHMIDDLEIWSAPPCARGPCGF